MKVGVARTPYLEPTSKAELISTLMRTALAPASSASSSYVGYAILHGAQVDDVKKMTAQLFDASASCSSSSLKLLTFLTYPLVGADIALGVLDI